MKTSSSKKITSADCVKCGLCCVSLHDQDRFADVTAEDEKRLGKKFVRLHVIHTHPFDMLTSALGGGDRLPQGVIATKWLKQRVGPFKGLEVCACVALRGSLLEKTSCSIYNKRPKVCHDAVKPGDKTCKQIRAIYKRGLKDIQQQPKGEYVSFD